MSKINKRIQIVLEDMIVDKFSEKQKALVDELNAVFSRDYEIINENKDKCKDSIVRVLKNAQNVITKILKTAGLEIGSKYYNGTHFIILLSSDGELKINWKDYIRPIEKSEKQEALERKLEKLNAKRKKVIDELVLRVSLGCKYNEVMEFINNIKV